MANQISTNFSDWR